MARPNTSKLKLMITNQTFHHIELSHLQYSFRRIEESESDRTERLEKWKTFLENEDTKKEIAEKSQQSDATTSSETPPSEIPKIETS